MGVAGSRSSKPLTLGAVLVILLATLSFGLLLKDPCVVQRFGDAFQLCHSDVKSLLVTEGLTQGRVPYIDRCVPANTVCDEYPMLTMYAMKLAVMVQDSPEGAFYVAVGLLTIAAAATAALLFEVVGRRVLFFVLAPALVLCAFIHWDLLAVFFATAALIAFLKERPQLCGLLVGAGASTKLYPALLLVPFIAQYLRSHKPKSMVRLIGGFIAVSTMLNLPFVATHLHAWATFFRFNGQRPADYDSLWYVACHAISGARTCTWSPTLINWVSVALFIGIVGGLWVLRTRKDPDFNRTHLILPILIVFLLTNKVYSPQYSLWLLPWFAYSLPDLRVFVPYQLAEVGVYATRFLWMGHLARSLGVTEFATYTGVSLLTFHVAVLIRDALLVLCLVAWLEHKRFPSVSPTLDGFRERFTLS